MLDLNQKYVIESVTKFLEIGRNGSFNIKCEMGKVTMDCSVLLVLGCQEHSAVKDSDSGPQPHQPRNRRRSRNSPSKLRRNWLRAEKYRANKIQTQFQTQNEKCVYDSSPTGEVFACEVIPVAKLDAQKVEIDEDVDEVSVRSSIEDNSSDDDDDNDAYEVATTEDCDSDDIEGSDLAFIVLCEIFVKELKYESIYERIHAYKKDSVQSESGKVENSRWSKDIIGPFNRMHQFGSDHQDTCVFKAKCIFEEGGRYSGDFYGWDSNWLHTYSNQGKRRYTFCDSKSLKRFCEEVLLIVSD